MSWEMAAGLEVHVELSTASKIFCGCSTAFGGEPNTQVCPVCTGLPGTLPVLNRQVVEYAVRAGLGLGCAIEGRIQFDRKHYFYPDLPKAYQITQLRLPICRDGGLEIETAAGKKRIGIREIHMEEDAGKLIHDPRENCTLVDYNRCGVPLLEIVSHPDFRTADEVTAYLEALREILLFLGVSDCRMQEGSLRADLNISVGRAGSGELGARTEMKNMNSFKAIHRAVRHETARQIKILEEGGSVPRETRRWDDDKGTSFAMRAKENAWDYRYFPEPDLPPMELPGGWIEEIRAGLPELPRAKRARYGAEYNLPAHDARVLTASRETARLFEETAALCGSPKEAANLIMGDLAHLRAAAGIPPENMRADPAKLARLVDMIAAGSINRTAAREVLEKILTEDADPQAYAAERNLGMLEDSALVEAAVGQALKENPQSVADFKGGKEKALAFLMGRVMRSLEGRADPRLVHRLLREALERM